jgi:hypothetical protein
MKSIYLKFISACLFLASPTLFAADAMPEQEDEQQYAYLMVSGGTGLRFIPNIGETMLFIPTLNLDVGTMLTDRNFIMVSLEHEFPFLDLDANWFDVGLKLGGLASKNMGVYTYIGKAELTSDNLVSSGGMSFGIGSYMKFQKLGHKKIDATVDWDVRIFRDVATDRPIFTTGVSIRAAIF